MQALTFISIHSKICRTDDKNKPLIDVEASIIGNHYEADCDQCMTNSYKLHHKGRLPTASNKAEYSVYLGQNSLVTKFNKFGEPGEEYRISVYGDMTYVLRHYEGGKVAAYKIVNQNSGYRLSMTGKAFSIMFPSWDDEKVHEEVSQAFDIGILVITLREQYSTTWEAVENTGMDEDEEFLSCELVEPDEWDKMDDGFVVVDGAEVACEA